MAWGVGCSKATNSLLSSCPGGGGADQIYLCSLIWFGGFGAWWKLGICEGSAGMSRVMFVFLGGGCAILSLGGFFDGVNALVGYSEL